MTDLLARGRQVGLRPLRAEDVGERYLGWMRNPDVLRRLEARFTQPTLESLRAFMVAFLAVGWMAEGRRPAQFVGEDGVEDQVLLDLVLRGPR